jgi:hypothetical protein
MHAYERGYTATSIEVALKEEPYFIDVTRYNYQISPYIERFGKEAVLVLDFDDFNANRSQVINQITEFLGVAPMSDTDLDTKRANVSIGGKKQHIRFDKKKAWHKIVERNFPKIWERITDNSARAFKERPVISDALQTEILSQLEPDIQAMEVLLQKDLSHWRQ